MGIKDRQRDNLAQLEAMLAEGTDDNGQPLSPEALENLTADIASLRSLTGTRPKNERTHP
ncbi:MAG: hypothetical protein ACOH1Y_14315 [Propionicimonas sp.]